VGISEAAWVVLQVCRDRISGQVIAGRLRAESIPVQVELLGPLPDFEQSVQVRVPRWWHARASQILAEPPPSEEELAELAVRTPYQDGAPE
jgi:hypothetical protein